MISRFLFYLSSLPTFFVCKFVHVFLKNTFILLIFFFYLWCGEVLKTNHVFTAAANKGVLSTEHKRNAYFSEHFQVVDPVEYRFHRLHQNTFVYVPLLRVLEILLNRTDVFEKAIFMRTCCQDNIHLLVVARTI